MRIKITLLVGFLSNFLALSAQNYEWTATSSISQYNEYSITHDAHGNVYTVGQFKKTVDFDPGSGTTNLTSVGAEDVFIQKLDASGNFIWAKSFGGKSYDSPTSVKVDANGNIYVLGSFRDTVDFDPGVGINNHISAGVDDAYILKLDSLGGFIWVKCFGGSSIVYPVVLKLDTFGHIYTSGSFYGTTDFDPGSSVYNLGVSSGSVLDIFIQKLDTVGNFIWARSFGGSNYEAVKDLNVNSTGVVYTAGWFRGTVDFDPGLGTSYRSAGSNARSFVQKVDTAGNFIWVRDFVGTAISEARSIETDARGNIYTLGDFGGTIDFNPGSGTYNITSLGSADAYIQKMDSAGNFIWIKRWGGVDNESVYDMQLGSDGNLYSIGAFGDTADFDPGTGTLKLFSNGRADVFIHKMDTAGNFGWAVSFGGTDYDYGHDLSINSSNVIYSTGYFKGNVDFDPGSGIDTINSGNVNAMFVHKLNQCVNTTATDSRTVCDSLKWIDGKTYTASNNSATHTLSNAGGCDSIVTLNLTINKPTTSMDTKTACDSLTWLDGNTYKTANNSATHTLTNAAGCDSVVTLDLTVNNSSTGNDVVTACFSWKWIDGNTYTTSNNTATHTITNAAGCDSMVTLDLTVNTLDTSITKNGITLAAKDSNATYQWIDCNNGNAPISGDTNKSFTATANGSYALVISKNSCTDTSSCVEITQVGVDDFSIVSLVSIYPNPTTGNVYIDLMGVEKVSVDIINAMGQVVMERIDISDKHHLLELNEDAGVYFIRMYTHKKTGSFKLLIE
ncbi:MAG: hypothetical protein CL840_08420 [Crocinitomicaceae bacterium]|nr:hypothetical protein [Crocinitomicaceae bacterium]|tara:strand:+ start:6903 stop:9257 length:2355 start_codon:yes stop_codon:yes gene_type:complete